MQKQPVSFQSHKTDLLLINEISRPSQIVQLQAPSNMNELHNLLKNKNAKAAHTRQGKQNAQAWLSKEGIDISPLIDRVRKAQQINVQKLELKKIEEDCLFYIPDMSYKKLDEYEEKANDYATLTLIQSNMKKAKFSKKLIDRVNVKFSETSGLFVKQPVPQGQMRMISQIRTQPRDEQKRQKYLKCITQMAKKNIRRQDLANQISATVHKKFWIIMTRHIKCINESTEMTTDRRIAEMYIESLKLIQEDCNQSLSRDIASLNYYLTTNYLQKMDRRGQVYKKDSIHGSFWGKAYILYRAGRKADFYNHLALHNENMFIQYFREADQAISNKQPITISVSTDVSDVFKQQLCFALKGEAKFSSQVFFDPGCLDFIWVFIRNNAIFYKNEQKDLNKFEENRANTLKLYAENPQITEQMLHNFFYLLAYDEITSMGLSDIMDQDDFVHFLICLNENPNLLINHNSDIQRILTNNLMLYIRELISLGKLEYVYYMAFIPKACRAAQISTILSASNLVSSFNWSYLRSCIPSNAEFEQIVRKTLQKQILTTNDYLSAAQKYKELLNSKVEAAKCILQFLVKNFLGNSYDDQKVHQAQTACSKYMYGEGEIENVYGNVLAFIKECRQLLLLLKDRKDAEIYKIIRNDKFLNLGSVLPQQQHQLFDTLISLSGVGMDAYFKFVKTVIKGLGIYFCRQNDMGQYNQFVSAIDQNLKFIFTFDQYQPFSNSEELNSLWQTINSSKYEVSTKR